jgi:hypothetical protein
MNEDRYPMGHLIKRLFDVALSIFSWVCLIAAIVISFVAEYSMQKQVMGLGLVVSVIGVFLEYRQKTVYEADHCAASILSNGLQAKYLSGVAKLRHKLVSANIIIIIAGICVSGYGSW